MSASWPQPPASGSQFTHSNRPVEVNDPIVSETAPGSTLSRLMLGPPHGAYLQAWLFSASATIIRAPSALRPRRLDATRIQLWPRLDVSGTALRAPHKPPAEHSHGFASIKRQCAGVNVALVAATVAIATTPAGRCRPAPSVTAPLTRTVSTGHIAVTQTMSMPTPALIRSLKRRQHRRVET